MNFYFLKYGNAIEDFQYISGTLSYCDITIQATLGEISEVS